MAIQALILIAAQRWMTFDKLISMEALALMSTLAWISVAALTLATKSTLLLKLKVQLTSMLISLLK